MVSEGTQQTHHAPGNPFADHREAVVQRGLVSGDGVNASGWLDEFTAVEQPPEVDDRDAMLVQVFRTHQPQALHQIQGSLSFSHGDQLQLNGCISKQVRPNYYILIGGSMIRFTGSEDRRMVTDRARIDWAVDCRIAPWRVRSSMAWQVLKQRSLPTGLVCAVPAVETVGAGGRWIPLEANNLWTAKNRL